MRKIGSWILAGALAAPLAFGGGAWAQQAPDVMPMPDGPAIVGSITVDGVEYSADDLTALVRVYQNDPVQLGELPAELYAAVIRLAAMLPPQGR